MGNEAGSRRRRAAARARAEMLVQSRRGRGEKLARTARRRRYNHASFCKLYSVYGEAYTHESTYEIRDPTTGNKRRVAMTIAELRAKLRRTRCATRFLGTTQTVEADDPRGFRRSLERFMDSSNVVADGACWPLVHRRRAEIVPIGPSRGRPTLQK